MSLGKSGRIGLLATLRGSAASVGAALSQLVTRRKSPEAPRALSAHKPVPEGPRWGTLVLMEKVGEGSFGEVYRAWDVTLEREVALKLMQAAAQEHPGLLQEARMLARLRHPNVVTVYGVDRHDNRSGVWMEFVEGDTLAAILEERGSLGAMEALLVGLDVCRALAAVHQSNLLHRDIKAQNVMRERGGRIVLMDFGLGRDAGENSGPEFGGTPLYMAPELYAGEPATVRSDIYSVGVLLFHLVTRAFPVEGATVQALHTAHTTDAPQNAKALRDLRSDLPSAFVRAVEKAVAKDPARRYATAGPMIAALEAALGARRFPISRRAFWWTAAPVSALGAGAGWWAWTRPTANVKAGASLLLTEISNATGDQQLNAVADVLRVQLAQSKHFNVLDSERIKDTLGRMTLAQDAKLDLPVAREVALRSGTPLLVYGTVSPLGAGLGLSLVIERIEGQPRTPLRTESKLFEARSKNGVFDAIHEAATWIRQTAGEATRDIAEFDTQPEEATTHSWEALNYFTQGEQLKAQNRGRDATAMYQQAVSADPIFALALARLAGEQSTQRLVPESFATYRKAVEALAKRHVTRREELRIRGFYANQTEDYDEAEKQMHALTNLYPNDSQAHHYRALALRNLGRLEEAREELLESQRYRNTQPTLTNLVAVSLLLRRPNEAASYAKQLPTGVAGYLTGQIKFLAGDYAGAEESLESASKETDARLRPLAFGALAALVAEKGRVHDALRILAEGIDSDSAAGRRPEQARKRLAAAHLYLVAGQPGAARDHALTAVRLDSDTSSLLRAGSVLAQAGFAADARTVRARMNASDEGKRFEAASTILDAEIAMAERRLTSALALYEKSDRLVPPIRPREFLARAWERAGRKEDALDVWRRIASKPELIWGTIPDDYDPGLWSESLLRVADLSQQLGFRKEGFAALDQFLKLREHADPDSPQSVLATKLLNSRQ